MARIGMPELIVIFLIVILLFGAAKLPQLARSIGEAIREFKKEISGKGSEAHKDKEKKEN